MVRVGEAMNIETLRASVRDYYGKVLASSQDLQTNACCATGAPPAHIAALLDRVHPDVQDRFYGCGFPFPAALAGATVVDLGCGSGRDVYVLSQLVGAAGFVHGIDMTPEQLAVARDTQVWHAERFGFANVAFHQGFIEDLAMIADASVDVVVSNCVVNLSPYKDRVLAEVARILKPGGEFYLSDVLADRRLPAEVAADPLLHAECLGGAMYEADFLALAQRTGFLDPRVVVRGRITVRNPEIEQRVGAARFSSVTLRLLKLAALEARCEDYGQVAVYRGTASAGGLFHLDDHHVFEAGRPERVCGNTALMLTGTRFAPHFDVIGDQRTHYGEFPCGPTLAAAAYAETAGATPCC